MAIEVCSAIQHIMHILDVAYVPSRDVAVEVSFISEQSMHVRDSAHVPIVHARAAVHRVGR